MEYEDCEFLNDTETEGLEVKEEPQDNLSGYTIEEGNLADAEDDVGGSEDMLHKFQQLQSKLEDLEEKIEQKYSSLYRKQENNFRLILSKLNWIQKNMSQRQSMISTHQARKTPSPVASNRPIIVNKPTPVVEVPDDPIPIPALRHKTTTSPLMLKTGPRPISIIRVKPRATPLKKMINITVNRATKRPIADGMEKTTNGASESKKNCPTFDFVSLPDTVKIVQLKKPTPTGIVAKDGLQVVVTPKSSGPPKIKTEMIPSQYDPLNILKAKPLIKTMNDMRSFERYLQINTYRWEVLRNIKRLGGSSMTAETMSVMRTLLSNVVQAHYTYQGLRKGKENFSTTMTWDLIRECIQARYPNATVDDIRKVVMDMLKNAPARIKLVEFKNTA